MSQALYRKWRPHHWEDVVGQEHVTQTLRNAVTAGRVAHAQLFAGPRGTGKTTTARLLAKAMNCLEADTARRPCDVCACCQAVNEGRFMDLIEIDAASNTSVEDVRDLRDKIGFSPTQGQYKMYIIDEVHMLSTAAFNALLKTLEEPPRHAMFILATTEVHKIPATVLSRCQRHEFRRIPVNDIVAYLKRIADGEGIEIEPEALLLVARQSAGGMRDAISLLDQLASMGGLVTLAMAQSVLGTATNQTVLKLFEYILEKDAAAGLACLHQALDAGSDPRQFSRQIVEYLRSLLMVRMGNPEQMDVTPEMRAQMASHAVAFDVPDLVRMTYLFNDAATDGRAWMPSLPLEMALVQSLAEPPEPPGAAVETQPAGKPAKASAPRSRTRLDSPPAPAGPAEVENELEQAPEPGDPLGNRRLDENWKQILNLTRQQDLNTYSLINSSKSRSLSGNILILGFASDVLKIKMEKNSNIELVQKVLQQVLGMEIEIRCITLSGKRTTPPPGVDSDGMVASALRDLGGEIVDIQ